MARMASPSPAAIPVIARRPIAEDQPEYREMMKYESGSANADAARQTGPPQEPWLNVLEQCEPGVPPALDFALTDPTVAPLVRGRVIDLGAGTCWVTARLSKLERVEHVVALDTSERFLTDVGTNVIRHYGGVADKISFAIGSFNDIPFPAASFDTVCLVAAIHHSLSPIKTLLEARRVLKPGGALLVIESPSSVLQIRQRRLHSIAISRSSGATELCYTKGELEYMLRHAGFDAVTFHPVAANTRGPLRKLLRAGLRATGLEDHVRPPTYVIAARQG
jgi:SAM-dependent methyltransferase